MLSRAFGSAVTLRAAAGALLVTVALLAVSQAYAHADRPPTTAYAVAAGTLAPGTALDADSVELVPVDLPAPLADRAFASTDALVGARTLAPLAPGELVLLSQVLPPDAAPDRGVDLAFGLPAERALGGAVRPGEAVDLVASFPSAETRVVARGAIVTQATTPGDDLLGDGDRVVLTVRLADPAELLDVVEAVDEGQVTVTRPAP